MKKPGLFRIYIIYCLVGLIFLGLIYDIDNVGFASTGYQKKLVCNKDTNIEILIAQLMVDLPSYANRILQRSRQLDSKAVFGSVILAGRPEFEPLPLKPTEIITNAGKINISGNPANIESDNIRQVFITTLERQYISNKIIHIQEYHWLFFTKTNSGWQLVMMFSRTGSYPQNQPISPPRDSSYGVIAEAIRNWLRDCQARNF